MTSYRRADDYECNYSAAMAGNNYYLVTRLTTFGTFRTFTTFGTFRRKLVVIRRDINKKAHFFCLKIIHYSNIMSKYGKIIVKYARRAVKRLKAVLNAFNISVYSYTMKL